MIHRPMRLYCWISIFPGCYLSGMIGTGISSEISIGTAIAALMWPYFLLAILILSVSGYDPNSNWFRYEITYQRRYRLAVITAIGSIVALILAVSGYVEISMMADTYSGGAYGRPWICAWLSGFLIGLALIFAVTGYWKHTKIYVESDDVYKD